MQLKSGRGLCVGSNQLRNARLISYLHPLKADSHIVCCSPAVPCRLECLSHLIYAVRPCLIHTCHAMPMPCSGHAVFLKATAQHGLLSTAVPCCAVGRRPCCAVALRRTVWSEHGMASVNQTRAHCVNQMGKTHSKLLAARHGSGMLCVNRPLVVLVKPALRYCLLNHLPLRLPVPVPTQYSIPC